MASSSNNQEQQGTNEQLPAYTPYESTVHNYGEGGYPAERWCYFAPKCRYNAYTLVHVTKGSSSKGAHEVCSNCVARPPPGYRVASMVNEEHDMVRVPEGSKHKRKKHAEKRK